MGGKKALQTNKQTTNEQTNKLTNTMNDHNSPPGIFQNPRANKLTVAQTKNRNGGIYGKSTSLISPRILKESWWAIIIVNVVRRRRSFVVVDVTLFLAPP